MFVFTAIYKDLEGMETRPEMLYLAIVLPTAISSEISFARIKFWHIFHRENL